MCDPVGAVEIAARLGVRRQTVDQWRIRRLFLEPRWTVGGRPAWDWPDVERWAQGTGHPGQRIGRPDRSQRSVPRLEDESAAAGAVGTSADGVVADPSGAGAGFA